MNIFVITGSSKGLGASIVKHLIKNKHNQVFGLSRSKIAENTGFKNIQMDLSDIDMKIIENLWNDIKKLNFEKIFLVNNAAIIEPIKKMGNCNNEDLKKNISTNLVAPMILINSFLKHFNGNKYRKIIANISSGSAYTPFGGWSAYCSSKAGLNMLTKTVADESHENLTIFSISPGIVETQMQKAIRESSKSDFKLVDDFINLKENGFLNSADFAAEKVIQILLSNNIKSGSILDIGSF